MPLVTNVFDYPDQATAEADGWVFSNTQHPSGGGFTFDTGIAVGSYPTSFAMETINAGYYSGQSGYVRAQKTFTGLTIGEEYTIATWVKSQVGNAWYLFATLDVFSGANSGHNAINGSEGAQALTVVVEAASTSLTVRLQALASNVSAPSQSWYFAVLTIDSATGATPTPGEVQGAATLVFTPDMDWQEPLTEQREFETPITAFYGDEEQREGLMEVPHRRLSFLVTTGEPRESGLVEALTYGGQDRTWWVPYWRGATWLAAAASIGQTTLALATPHLGYEDGQGIMFWQDAFHAEVATLSEVTPTLLTFSALTAAWAASGAARAKVVPVYRALVAPSQDFSYLERGMKQTHVTFDVLP